MWFRLTSLSAFELALALCALVCLPIGSASCRPRAALERHEYRSVIMGSGARIVLWAPDEPTAASAAREAFARMSELDTALSDYLLDGDVARLREARPPMLLSPDLCRVLVAAVDLARRTDGAFDPTLGALTRLWRDARRTGALPDPARIEAARARSGVARLVLDPATRTLSTTDGGGVDLDFGGIAKGDACDQALAVLRERGLPLALVELGGDLAVGEPPPGAEGWRVEVRCASAADATMLLVRQAVATSGDHEQHVDIGGVRYSHVLDPRTGRGLTESACATVVAPTGAQADALASAACVLGPERAHALLGGLPGVRLHTMSGSSPPGTAPTE